MNVLILAGDGVEDWELLYPHFRMREEGFTVDIAAPKAAPLRGRHDCYPIEANISFFDVWGADYYDVLILPGGMSQEAVRLDEKALNIVRGMFERNKPVVAIGHGIETTVSAGVMEGRRATCAAGVRDELQLAGAEYVDEEVVVDGNLVTSRGVDDLPAFCRELVRLIRS